MRRLGRKERVRRAWTRPESHAPSSPSFTRSANYIVIDETNHGGWDLLASRGRRPLILTGDCLAAVGVLAGRQRRHESVSIVWLDAHGDFNTLQTTTSGYISQA